MSPIGPVPSSGPGAVSPSPVRAATTLALWAAAWQGGAPADAVLAAIDALGHRAGVRAATAEGAEKTGLAGPGSPSSGTAELLPLLREGGTPELLLPAAGDVRGLPLHGAFTVAALDAGAAVAFPVSGIGVVPMHGQWRVDSCPGGSPVLDLSTARWDLDEAISEATSRLTAADLAREAAEVRSRIAALMRAEAVDCPPGTPPAASALLAKAISLQALLAVASGHETAAVNNYELAIVDDALRPLARSVRDGRRAAVAAACATLAQTAAHPSRY